MMTGLGPPEECLENKRDADSKEAMENFVALIPVRCIWFTAGAKQHIHKVRGVIAHVLCVMLTMLLIATEAIVKDVTDDIQQCSADHDACA